MVGGGVNGAGIARDASGRGLKVLLVEQADLASATSSSSSKLIHGGLRYLEYYEFRLVRAALSEREVLLKSAPGRARRRRWARERWSTRRVLGSTACWPPPAATPPPATTRAW